MSAAAWPEGCRVGARLRLLTDIYDDGEDHHPPGYVGYSGEHVFVRRVDVSRLAVSHANILDSAFLIYAGEFTLDPAPPGITG